MSEQWFNIHVTNLRKGSSRFNIRLRQFRDRGYEIIYEDNDVVRLMNEEGI